MIKKSLFTLLIIFCSALLFSAILTPTFAQEGSILEDVISETGGAYDTEDTIQSQIGNIIQTVLTFSGVALLLVILYGGFLWMTAGGNPEQVKKGQAWLKNGVIGIIIVFSAYIIADFVIDAITGSGSGGATIED